jgi:hypothetical protein
MGFSGMQGCCTPWSPLGTKGNLLLLLFNLRTKNALKNVLRGEGLFFRDNELFY